MTVKETLWNLRRSGMRDAALWPHLEFYRDCARCSATFPKRKGSRYCSVVCVKGARRDAWRRVLMVRSYYNARVVSCAGCNQIFMSGRRYKYCSVQCLLKDRVRIRRERYRPKSKTFKICVAVGCNKIFEMFKNKKFCSPRCRSRAKYLREEQRHPGLNAFKQRQRKRTWSEQRREMGRAYQRLWRKLNPDKAKSADTRSAERKRELAAIGKLFLEQTGQIKARAPGGGWARQKEWRARHPEYLARARERYWSNPAKGRDNNRRRSFERVGREFINQTGGRI